MPQSSPEPTGFMAPSGSFCATINSTPRMNILQTPRLRKANFAETSLGEQLADPSLRIRPSSLATMRAHESVNPHSTSPPYPRQRSEPAVLPITAMSSLPSPELNKTIWGDHFWRRQYLILLQLAR